MRQAFFGDARRDQPPRSPPNDGFAAEPARGSRFSTSIFFSHSRVGEIFHSGDYEPQPGRGRLETDWRAPKMRR